MKNKNPKHAPQIGVKSQCILLVWIEKLKPRNEHTNQCRANESSRVLAQTNASFYDRSDVPKFWCEQGEWSYGVFA